MKAYGGSLTQPMTEVTPSCDTAHNQVANWEPYGPFAAAAAVGHATKFFGNFAVPRGEIPATDRAARTIGAVAPAHACFSRARDKSLRSLYQTLRSNERHWGFNKRTEKAVEEE